MKSGRRCASDYNTSCNRCNAALPLINCASPPADSICHSRLRAWVHTGAWSG
jgi:hypothetical protein